MIEFFQRLITSVVVMSIIITITYSLMPEGGTKRVFSLVSGIIMALTIIIPFIKNPPVFEFDLDLPEPAETYSDQRLLTKLIEENTSAYIVNKAQALGLEISVRVICDEGGLYPVPGYVLVYSDYPETAYIMLKDLLENELGISAGRMTFSEDKNP